MFAILFQIIAQQAWPTQVWETRQPAEVAMAAAPIEDMLRAVKAGEHGALHGLVLVKDGYLVAEDYYPVDPRLPAAIGRGQGPHQLQSATKSVLSLLVGIAEHRGLLTTEDRLSMHLPRRMAKRGDDWNPRLADLLTMRGGLEWKQWANIPRDQRDHVRLLAESDWLAYILKRPKAEQPPGKQFGYSDANPLLLAGAISRARGKTIEAFAHETLFYPLGIETAGWQVQDEQGLVHTGAGLAMTARDAAKLGMLLAAGGVWDGTRLIGQDYLKRATQIRVERPFGKREGLRQQIRFGYLWWLYADGDRLIPFAIGMGEQGILVSPSDNLVLVTTGWIQDPDHALKVVQLYRDYVKPALGRPE
jgi:CubicO group peptidase (beta-lactamase class C family)